MYTLLSGAYAEYTKVDEYYVLIIGVDNAGKTTLVEQLKHLYMKSYRELDTSKINPTVGLNVARLNMKGMQMQ